MACCLENDSRFAVADDAVRLALGIAPVDR